MPAAVLFALLVALPCGTLTALAQPAATAARPDPLDPKASVPALRYESSLLQYRRLGEDQPVAWRDANDAVARIGGWRTYAREAQQPEVAPAAKPAAAAPAAKPKEAAKPMPMPMPQGHGGHKMP